MMQLAVLYKVVFAATYPQSKHNISTIPCDTPNNTNKAGEIGCYGIAVKEWVTYEV